MTQHSTKIVAWSIMLQRYSTGLSYRSCYGNAFMNVVCNVGYFVMGLMSEITPLITSFMGPTWDPSGADRTQMGPMLAPLTLLSGPTRPRFYAPQFTQFSWSAGCLVKLIRMHYLHSIVHSWHCFWLTLNWRTGYRQHWVSKSSGALACSGVGLEGIPLLSFDSRILGTTKYATNYLREIGLMAHISDSGYCSRKCYCYHYCYRFRYHHYYYHYYCYHRHHHHYHRRQIIIIIFITIVIVL